MVLQGLHRTWPPLVTFCQQLAADLGHPVQANAYVTPPQSQGFSDHYDVHDVFVLQIAGEKRWRIHEPGPSRPRCATSPGPTARRRSSSARPTEPLIDVVLRPGDCLYLPRGFLHAATALGGVSTHLTLGRAHAGPGTPWPSSSSSRPCAPSPTTRRCGHSLPLGVDLSRSERPGRGSGGDPRTPDRRRSAHADAAALADGSGARWPAPPNGRHRSGRCPAAEAADRAHRSHDRCSRCAATCGPRWCDRTDGGLPCRAAPVTSAFAAAERGGVS